MRHGLLRMVFCLFGSACLATAATAYEVKDFSAVIKRFSENPGVAPYFSTSYGYAVWDTIAKGGLGVGAATGLGQVYVGGKVVGFSRLADVSFGFQAGGQAYSQIIFLEDERAYRDFTSGNFEFEATANAVAITAGAGGSAGTQGAQGTATTGGTGDGIASGYKKGLQVFTLAKGGLMYQAAIAGQKYGFEPVTE